MKNTKVMVAVIFTFIATWLLLAFIVWCVTPFTFQWLLTNMVTLIIMFIVGWIPAIIVGLDYNQYLENKY